MHNYRHLPRSGLRAGVLALLGALSALTTLAGAQTVAADQPIATLPQISATAQQEEAAGPVMGYVASRSATGTKTDTALLETPQSVTVIGAEQIETLRAQSITDAVAYSIGALRPPYTERTGDEILLRGFSIPTTLRDGMRYQANRFDGQQEPYGLERIEVLKGASSILYGSAEPGGVLNTVSKRPSVDAMRELNVELGSFDRKQVSGDFTGALTDDGQWSYRLTGLKRDSDTSIDYVTDNRLFIAPALTWRPNARTSLTLLTEYQRDRSMYGSDGLPLSGTASPNPNGRIARERFVGEPGYDRYHVNRYSAGYLFEQALSDQLTLRHGLRRYRSDQQWSAINVGLELAADGRTTLDRSGQDRLEDNSQLTSDTSLQYQWRSGAVSHTTLAGFDYVREKVNTGRYDREVSQLDLYAPVYGSAIGPATPGGGWRGDSRRRGLYLQDQMKLAERWVLLLGGRQDWVRQSLCSYHNPALCSARNEATKAFSGRAGVVYLAPNGMAPFASFSQSFTPTNGADFGNNRFKPTRGEQIEAGVRYQPAGRQLMLAAAVYQLTQSNVLSDDPRNRGFQSQQGEVRSRGVELEARGKLGRNTQVLGAYTYTDARTTAASPLYPELVGKRTAGIPYNQFSLWFDHTLNDLGAPGLKAGAGLRYVGETASQWHDVPAPDYTVFDAMASYTAGPWRLSVNISNLADKNYIAACPYRCFFGEPRKVIGAVTYRW